MPTTWTGSGIYRFAAARSLLKAAAAQLYCCFSELSKCPRRTHPPSRPCCRQTNLLERITSRLDKLKFLHKVCLWNIFRPQKRFSWCCAVGRLYCTLITALGIRAIRSRTSTAAGMINLSCNDYTITFDSNISQKEKEQFVLNQTTLTKFFLSMLCLIVDILQLLRQIDQLWLLRWPKRPDREFPLKDKDGLLAYPSAGNYILISRMRT